MAAVARVSKGREGGGRKGESSGWGGRRGLACRKAFRAVYSPRALLTDMSTVGSCRRWGWPPPLLGTGRQRGWGGVGCGGALGERCATERGTSAWGAARVSPSPLPPPPSLPSHPLVVLASPFFHMSLPKCCEPGGGGGRGVGGGWLLVSLASTPSLLDPHTRPQAAARRPLPRGGCCHRRRWHSPVGKTPPRGGSRRGPPAAGGWHSGAGRRPIFCHHATPSSPRPTPPGSATAAKAAAAATPGHRRQHTVQSAAAGGSRWRRPASSSALAAQSTPYFPPCTMRVRQCGRCSRSTRGCFSFFFFFPVDAASPGRADGEPPIVVTLPPSPAPRVCATAARPRGTAAPCLCT